MSFIDAAAWVWPVVAAAMIIAAGALLFVRTRLRRTVFISYRRSESAGFVAALAEPLRQRFGSSIFHDQVSIGPGEPYPSVIERRLLTSDVVAVVIGPAWLSVTNEHGIRLQQPDDVVRHEVKLALGSGARVIPLLLGGATMPTVDELPSELRALALRNAMSVSLDKVDEAARQFIAAVDAAPVQRTPWMVLLAHAAIVAVVLLYALSGGFLEKEIASVLFIVTPLFVATGAVTLVHTFGVTRPRARSAHVPASTLWVPLGLAAAVAVLVAMKGANVFINKFGPFQTALGVIEILLGINTGIVLSSLFMNRSEP